ncbi:MAG: sugar transporter, partial [Gammaproteobacteria bacterium]
MNELRNQARSGAPERVVQISGQVVYPGEYPLEPDMTLADLVRAAGGLTQTASTFGAELVRLKIEKGQQKLQTETVPLPDGWHTPLRPYDSVNIRPLPGWAERETVVVEGEVLYPGEYRIRPDESLRQFIQRIGGLTERAFIPGVVFSRADLRKKEAQEIKRLTERLQANLASLSLEQSQVDAKSAEAFGKAQALLPRLQSMRPVGRLVIDLAAVLDGKTDVKLRDGDKIYVPRIPQEVTVLGEVQVGTSHLWSPGLSRDDYINRSGGLTNKADEDRIYVVKANGSVVAGARTLWFGSAEQKIDPGDTIVVPVDLTRMRPINLWQT